MPAIAIRPPAPRTLRVRTTPSLSESDYDDWQAEMEMLRDLLSVRPKERAGLSPSDRWSGTINTRIYALVRRYRTEGKLRIIHKIIASLPREPLKTKVKDNIFYLALYAAREDGEITMLTDKNLSRFARQMSYADRHDIQPEMIVGFVYQQGNERNLAYKLKSGEYEPWFIAKSGRPASE